MNNSYNSEHNQFYSEKKIDYRVEFFKYLYFWKFFVLSVLIFSIASFLFLRYTAKEFNSTAKIKILDKEESSFKLPTAKDLFSKNNINIENEIEVIKSYPILAQVCENNNLNIEVLKKGSILNSIDEKPPLSIMPLIPIDSLNNFSFQVNIKENKFEVVNLYDNVKYLFNGFSTAKSKHSLPFQILLDVNSFEAGINSYIINFYSKKNAVKKLRSRLVVDQLGNESDIISLQFKSSNKIYSENILNEIISVFNEDGVADRRLLHKRTIDFVNDRYAYLSAELDSIEIAKQDYKAENDLVDLSTNSVVSIEKSVKSEEKIFSTENQISIIKMLISTLDSSEIDLLPANLEIESQEINTLISEYNQSVVERKKLILSAGTNNPSFRQLNEIISDKRLNIIFSLKNHLKKLKNLKIKLSKQFYKYDEQMSNIPEKEKVLRSIERNQQIKESLYLFLLQKREEAQVSFAVTEPSIKVVEYAESDDSPLFPQSNIIYVFSVLIGLIIPFITLYLMFFFNNKIYSKSQLEELNLPFSILGEIPEINKQSNTSVYSADERSPLAESFRVISSNMKFLKPKKERS